MRVAVLPLAAAAALLAGRADAISCATYQNEVSPDGSLGFCAGIVDYEYFSEAANNAAAQLAQQQRIEREIASRIAIFPTVFSVMPETCIQAYKLAECTRLFPRCKKLDPFFLNGCLNSDNSVAPCGNNGVCNTDVGSTKSCAAEPLTRIGSNKGTAWDEGSCTSADSKFNFERLSTGEGFCYIAVPLYPCSDVCKELVEMDSTAIVTDPETQAQVFRAKCPLISGRFFSHLQKLASSSNQDTVVREQATAVLTRNGCAGGNDATCGSKDFTINVLSLVESSSGNRALPNCKKTVRRTLIGSDSFNFEEFSDNGQEDLSNRISGNIQIKFGNGLNCGPDSNPGVFSCNEVRDVADCTRKAEIDSNPLGQASLDFVPDDHVCKAIIGSAVNTDVQLAGTLQARETAILQKSGKGTDEIAQCASSDKFDSLYIVPPIRGLTPIPSRFDANGREQDVQRYPECEVNNQKFDTRFGNVPNLQKPLCKSSLTGQVAFNARDCALLRIQDLNLSFPRFAKPSCRATYLEMFCHVGLLKPQIRQLCLVDRCINDPSQGGQQNRVPFNIVLPRFPSKAMCLKFQEECAGVLASSPVLEPFANPAFCLLTVEQLLEQLAQSSAGNGMTFFGDQVAFGSLQQFPDVIQKFIDESDLPKDLQDAAEAVGIKLIDDTFTTTVAKPTATASLYKDAEDLTPDDLKALQQEFCDCPIPLVTPDDITSPTIQADICCALPCFGTMYTKEDLRDMGALQLTASSISLACGLFMVVTWGFFEEKRKQYMTFWFSFCSFNATFAVWLVAISTGGDIEQALCADNSTPHDIKTTGFTTCVFQSVWLLFFASAECAWWFVQAVDLFRKIVLGTRNTDETKRYYHIFAWAVPTIVIGLVFILRASGYKAPTPFCFFSPDTASSTEFLIFYTFVIVSFVLGTLMMMSVLAVIVRHAKAVARQGSSAGAKFRQQYRIYRTPVLFVMVFVFFWIIIFSFRISVNINEDIYRTEAESWINCLLTNFLKGVVEPATDPNSDISGLVNPADDQVGCGVTQPGGVPKNSILLMFTTVMLQSVLVFVIFGAKADNFLMWSRYIGCSEPVESQHDQGYGYPDSKSGGSTGTYQTSPHRGYVPESLQDESYYERDPRGPAPAVRPPSMYDRFQSRTMQSRTLPPPSQPPPAPRARGQLKMFPGFQPPSAPRSDPRVYQQRGPGSSGGGSGGGYVPSTRFDRVQDERSDMA